MPETVNNTQNVAVGKPKIGGAVYAAPLGTPLPATAGAELDAAFECAGYISEDGMTNAKTRTTESVKDWGGNEVMTPQTEKKDTFKLKFIEALNKLVLRLTHGDANVTGTLEEGITIRENEKELDKWSWVVDMILNENAIKRIVIPIGKITEIAEVLYKANDPIGYDSTMTAYAYPEWEGDTHREYIQGSGGGDDPGELKTLTVTSEEGSAIGTTSITVSPEKDTDNIYMVKLAAEETAVEYDDDVSEWTAWDGEANIEAEEDQVITVVEATSDYKARGAGSATVVVNTY